MPFTQKYSVIPRYLTAPSKRRSGQLLSTAKFLVAHDTGNPNSTASGNVSYYQSTVNQAEQSAHIFVDDKEIIECVPALTGTPEKAWHVRYDATVDNQRFGAEANDAAFGVEYCYGSNINSGEAYKRYVWVLAYLCYKFNLAPENSVIGHYILDPERRSDPVTGLAASGRTYDQLLRDIVLEYKSSTQSTRMKLIKNSSSNKVYAIGADNKKHWIINEETFTVGQAMGLWGGFGDIQVVNDDPHAEGNVILLVKP